MFQAFPQFLFSNDDYRKNTFTLPHAVGCITMHDVLRIYCELCTQITKCMWFGAQLSCQITRELIGISRIPQIKLKSFTVNLHASGCSIMHKSLEVYRESCTQAAKYMRFGARQYRDFVQGSTKHLAVSAGKIQDFHSKNGIRDLHR